MTSKELDKVGAIDEFFTRHIWLVGWPGGARLQGVSLKVTPTGYLCILKFISGEGPKVAFTGKGGLEGLYRSLQSPEGREALTLRPDQFALDNLEKKV